MENIPNSRLFYIQLWDVYYDNLVIKTILSKPSGADIIVCHQKMLLKTLNTNGWFIYEGILASIEEEISTMINANLDIVTMTIKVLSALNLINCPNEESIQLLWIDNVIQSGSIAKSTLRSRKSRLKNMLQCNTDATPCDIYKINKKNKKIKKSNNIISPDILSIADYLLSLYPQESQLNDKAISNISLLLESYSQEEIIKYIDYVHYLDNNNLLGRDFVVHASTIVTNTFFSKTYKKFKKPANSFDQGQYNTSSYSTKEIEKHLVNNIN
ncbi:MAG: phage replisome organizer N-terminal domain-containing protein [Lachnospiraceae bacterium]|nr:phage replisome organizer N-terminal domain-containing protein [Lachnospiraceae bacterium]